MQCFITLVQSRCPENSNGRMVDATDNNRGCSVDSVTGLPTNCIYELYPYKTDKASLMYAEFSPSVGSALSIVFFLCCYNEISRLEMRSCGKSLTEIMLMSINKSKSVLWLSYIVIYYTCMCYSELILQVNRFCQDSGSDDLQHDGAAPNPQNSQCGRKSAWEVLAQHEDFGKLT